MSICCKNFFFNKIKIFIFLILVVNSGNAISHWIFNPYTYAKIFLAIGACYNINIKSDLIDTNEDGCNRLKKYHLNNDKIDWNDKEIKEASNCYNFAINKVTGSPAVPGCLKEGCAYAPYLLKPMSCDLVGDYAKHDGLRELSSRHDSCDGHKVLLTVDSGSYDWRGDFTLGDFHWYRESKDENGEPFWSHKPGKSSPTLCDAQGKKIVDIDSADTGSYRRCNYYCVDLDEFEN